MTQKTTSNSQRPTRAILVKPADSVDVKPGYKTTEFYKSLAIELIGIAAAFGLISPGQTEILQELPDATVTLIDTASRAIGLIVAAFSQWSYTKSRTIAKQTKPPCNK